MCVCFFWCDCWSIFGRYFIFFYFFFFFVGNFLAMYECRRVRCFIVRFLVDFRLTPICLFLDFLVDFYFLDFMCDLFLFSNF